MAKPWSSAAEAATATMTTVIAGSPVMMSADSRIDALVRRFEDEARRRNRE